MNEYFIEVLKKICTIFNHLANNLSISLQWYMKNDLTLKFQIPSHALEFWTSMAKESDHTFINYTYILFPWYVIYR
jgi:hypothetical protein